MDMLTYADFSIAEDGDVLVITDEAGLKPLRPVTFTMLEERVFEIAQDGHAKARIVLFSDEVVEAIERKDSIKLLHLGDILVSTFEDVRRVH
jgi:hypothetical protein